MKTFKVTILLILSPFLQVVLSNELRGGGNNQRRTERVEEGYVNNVYKGDLDIDGPDELDLDISTTPTFPSSPCARRCPNRGDVAYKVDGVCTCLSPCEEVCGSMRLRCDDGFMGATAWAKAEKRKCFELEIEQGGSLFTRMFLRTTCKCPERDYSISEACEPKTQANLKNCILADITANYEINFGTLENVQLRHVQTIGSDDIDFQGEVHNSHFCHLEAGEDIEFGGEECPIQFHDNYVKLMTIGEDLQFEQGTWVGPDNIFGTVNIEGNFRFDDANNAIRDTEVWENHFDSIDAGGMCFYNGIDESEILVFDNTCDDFDVDNDSACDPAVFGGFTCVG